MYDIFFISSTSETDEQFFKIKSKYPRAVKLNSANRLDDISKISFTRMFWVIWDDFILDDDFDLNMEVPDYDQKYIHIWKNGNFFDGLALFPKNKKISTKEFNYRFYTNDKKEIDQTVSQSRPFDIIFLSYNESNADENYEKLKIRYPRAKRVHGVKGIHQAHIEAAKISSTFMFFVVDADAIIEDDFDFKYEFPYWEKNMTVVWRSRNPINGLEYGYGGVKLFNKELTINMNVNSTDMTTSISNKFIPVSKVSNITAFNTDEFSTWKSAFRECVKLSSKSIQRQNSEETESRLETWCSVAEGRYSEYALKGAIAGREYGRKYKDDFESLKKINDFEWLKEFYESK